jgi:hypothetical protein
MATFPKLRTNAVAQYPATRTVRFQNQALRFLDGTEQLYRESAGPLHRWGISLTQLDPGEMAALEEFFAETQGSFGSFGFTDPWDGREFENCSLESDDFDLMAVEELDGRASLTVVENRG